MLPEDVSGRDRRWWLPTVLAIEVLCFLPALFQTGIIRGPLPKISDSTRLFYPWNIFWRDEVSAGRWPFWNPFMFGGFPMAAEPQTQTFYPAHLLWLVLPPDLAFKLSFLLHILIASWLMYRLVRTLDGSRFGAAVAALVYGLHGQLIIFVAAGWIHQVSPMAWAPGVLWMVCRAFKDPRRWPGGPLFGAAAFLGLQVISGHPEWVRYTLFVVALLIIGGRAYHRSFARRLAIGAYTIVLGLLIGAVQLLPLVQATLNSSRGQSALESGAVRAGAGLPLLSLPTLVVPRLFGPWDPAVTVDGLVHKLSGSLVSFGESLVYVGVLPLVLAFLAWRTRSHPARPGQSRGGAGVWLTIALVGVLFAMQDVTHLQSALDFVIPLDAAFRSPARFVFLTNLSLAVLAGLGASRLEDGRLERAARTGFAVAALLVAGGAVVLAIRPAIVSFALEFVSPPVTVLRDSLAHAGGLHGLGTWAVTQSAWAMLASAALVAVSSGALAWMAGGVGVRHRAALVGIVAVDLALYAGPFLTSVVPAAAVYSNEERLLRPIAGQPGAGVSSHRPDVLPGGDNAAVLFRVRSLLGYDGFTIAEWDRLWKNIASAAPEIHAAAGVTHFIRTDSDGVASIEPVAHPRGHVWWTDSPEFVATADDAAAALPALAPRGHVALESPGPGTLPMIERPGSSTPLAVKPMVTQDVPGRLVATVDAPRDGWLVFTEMMYPGWTARVNGSAVPIARAFGSMQAVKIPAGSSTIELAFRPSIVWWGAGISMLGLAVAALGAWWPRRR
jgi:hypothetical protein